ncbi:MAG: ImmA/IrrE family metallo-endopeptidase [Pyrinomonadaceae bacterium]
MQFLIEKISKLNLGWNERSLSEVDLYRLCRRFKIVVQEMPLAVGGFYYRVMDRDFIAVDSKLPPIKKLAVLYHELGHFLFHMPAWGATANFHGVGRRTRQEIEADTFALCALIPREWIATRSVEDLIDLDGFPSDMIADRLKILADHGL